MSWRLLENSLLVSGLATILAISAGFVAALWLMGLERAWRNRVLALTVLALALPPFLATNCWLHFFGDTGVWRAWLPLNIFSPAGAAWILALLYWPITLLLVWTAWQRLEPAQLEADPVVSGFALIRGLILPLARGGLVQAVMLTFVLALNNFAVPALLQVKVFPAVMWVRFNTTFDTLGALQLSWPMVVAPLVLLLWCSRRGVAWPRFQAAVPAKVFRRQLGKGCFWLAGATASLLLLLAVALPLAQIASVNRTWTELPGALTAGQNAVWNSFWYAAFAATLIIAVGVVYGMWSAPRHLQSTGSRRFRKLKLLGPIAARLLWLPFLLPGVLLGIGLIVIFNRPALAAFYESVGIVLLAFVIRYFAPGRSAAQHALETADPDLTDAARLDGATRWQTLRFVQWPQIAPPLAAAWYIIFLLCLWDVESMILVVPPGGETLALRIFNLLHYGHNAQVNALCLALLALAVAPLVVWCVGRGILNLRFQILSWKRASITLTGLLLLPLAGCAPKLAPNEAALPSRYFSRAEVIGSRGVGIGEFSKPRSVTVDREDNFYVVDWTGRVQKFAPDGRCLMSWQIPTTDFDPDLSLARDAEGNIVVLDPHRQQVHHFTPAGRLVAEWGQVGTEVGQFTMPSAIAVNSLGDLYVSEYGARDRVQRFSLKVTGRGFETAGAVTNTVQAQFLGSFGHAGTGPGQFNRAEGLGVDSQDRVYVADSCNHRIQIFSSDGRFLRMFGRPGSGRGELSYPYDVRVDRKGRIYVCEFGNSRIQVFDADGQSLEIIGGPGVEPGRFSNPWSLALDSQENLYVADTQNYRVQKLIRKVDGRASGIRRRFEENRFALSCVPRSEF